MTEVFPDDTPSASVNCTAFRTSLMTSSSAQKKDMHREKGADIRIRGAYQRAKRTNMNRQPLKGPFCDGRFQVRKNKKIKCIGRRISFRKY